MKTRANAIIAGLALAVLVVVGIVVAGAQRTAPTPYDSASAAPTGALVLYRWLEALGYTPRRLTSSPLQTGGLGVMFVLEPQDDFSPAEADATLRWVRAGGALVLLEDENGGDTTLLDKLGLTVQPLDSIVNTTTTTSGTVYGAAPVQPLLAHPPLRGLDTTASADITGADPAIITVLGNGGLRARGAHANSRVTPPDPTTPVLVYERLGRGRIYAGSTPDVLTNGRIGVGDNRRLVPNLLAGLPAGATVGLDDYHLVPHTAATQQPLTLNDALYGTAWGRALLYALALIFLYIALTGRRLGRALRPIPERGRSLAEYVVSMAAIFRRAGLRTNVLALWQDDLRRALAGPGGRRGRADDEVVAEATRRAGLTPQESAEALTLLRARAALDERALVELCRRIARLQDRLTHIGA